jgi:peptidoglycan/xylan/chitin deacetylase (PgdA/CDA1 family)
MIHDDIRAKEEILEDKRRLENITGTKTLYFAYPFGAHVNPDIGLIDMLKDVGYKGAVTTVPGFNTIESHPFLLRREISFAGMPKRQFRARIYGNHDLVRHIKKQFLGV